jgi:hypothetical protein
LTDFIPSDMLLHMAAEPIQPPAGPTTLADTEHHSNGSDGTFHEETAAVLRELRPALAEVVEGIQPPVTRVVDLRRRLKLGQQLCWGLFNAATTRDIHELPALLPGRRGMERFFEASAKHGVPPEAIERARASFDRFEQSVARHARRRDAFAAMAAQAGGNGRNAGAAAQVRQKRAAFRASSLLWGREARASFSLMALRHNVGPSGSPHRDFIVIKGAVGLHRSFGDTPLHAVTQVRRMQGDDAEATPIHPIDPRESEADSVGLLRDFCTQPLPAFRVTESGAGHITHELVSTSVGATAEVTYFTGHVGRGVPVPEVDEGVAFRRLVSLPEEASVVDVLLHPSVWDSDTAPEVQVYAAANPARPEPRESEVLPIHEEAHFMGWGVEPGRTRLVPGYVDMLSYAMQHVGWNPKEFRLFRCLVEYPLVQSTIRLKFVRAIDTAAPKS